MADADDGGMTSIDPTALAGDLGDLAIALPEGADDAEAAAIAAAIGAHLRAEAAAGVAAGDGDAGEGVGTDWTGEKWAFAGRMRGLGSWAPRVPTRAPRDAWTAAGRADRF